MSKQENGDRMAWCSGGARLRCETFWTPPPLPLTCDMAVHQPSRHTQRQAAAPARRQCTHSCHGTLAHGRHICPYPLLPAISLFLLLCC